METASITIHIVGGKGKMGQWFKKFFQERNCTVTTSGRELQKEQIAAANIVIISVPIPQTEEVITQIIPFMAEGALLTDITSIKTLPLQAMREAQCATLGMHPLFGPQTTALAGQKIVFCHQKDNVLVPWLQTLFQEEQMEIITLTPEEHDKQMAYIQCCTHLLNLLFAKVLFGETDVNVHVATPNFHLQSLIMGRILQQDLSLMADLQMYNPYFEKTFASLLVVQKDVLIALKQKNVHAFTALFNKEHDKAKTFATFAVEQTNKILPLLIHIKTYIPQSSVVKAPAHASVAYLGPKGTYSEQVTMQLFPEKTQSKHSSISFDDIFSRLMENTTDFAIIPAENSLEGTVRETIDLLMEYQVYVVGSFSLPVHHQLLSFETNLASITTVYSHPQALAQCKNWLKTHLPKATYVMTTSTTAALVHPEQHAAYISSLYAAQIYHMPIIKKDIEDNPTNMTKFYCLSKHFNAMPGLQTSKTLLFITVLNRIGVLKDILEIFEKYDVNLTKLESRPSKEKPWDYGFFLEIDREYQNPTFSVIIQQLELYCQTVRVLGVT